MKFTPGRVTAQKLDKVTGEPIGDPVDIGTVTAGFTSFGLPDDDDSLHRGVLIDTTVERSVRIPLTFMRRWLPWQPGDMPDFYVEPLPQLEGGLEWRIEQAVRRFAVMVFGDEHGDTADSLVAAMIPAPGYWSAPAITYRRRYQ